MSQTKTIISAIAEFLLGKKYYANIITVRGVVKYEISSFIFASRAEAEQHRATLASTASYLWVETISFRSRIDYSTALENNPS